MHGLSSISCPQRNFTIQLLTSLTKISLRETLPHYGTCHLGLFQLLKINECARYGAHLLHTHQFVERRHDFQQKGTTRNFRESTITFLGDESARRTKICCVFMTLVSSCLKGSYAKAMSNNNDSLCCNDSNHYCCVEFKMYSK